MNKNLYVKKLKNLSEQINIMLMEAELFTAIKVSNGSVSKLPPVDPEAAQANYEYLKEVAKQEQEIAKKAGTSLKDIGESIKGTFNNIKQNVTDSSAWKTIVGHLGKLKDPNVLKYAKGGLIAVAVTATTVLGRSFIGMKRLANNTNNAINADNYADMAKYVNALKKMSNNSAWNTLMTPEKARVGAAQNFEVFRKSYIGIGVALVLVSIIFFGIFGFGADAVKETFSALGKLNFKGVLEGLLKLIGHALIALPALIGVCLIYIGIKGFPQDGTAEKIMAALSPCIKGCNIVVKKVLEMVQQMGAKSAYVKSLRRTNKVKYLAF